MIGTFTLHVLATGHLHIFITCVCHRPVHAPYTFTLHVMATGQTMHPIYTCTLHVMATGQSMHPTHFLYISRENISRVKIIHILIKNNDRTEDWILGEVMIDYRMIRILSIDIIKQQDPQVKRPT